jgi:hypothetical protein
MAYINQPPELRAIFEALDMRLSKLETAQRFTVPIVTTNPSNPRNGDMWYNSTSSVLYFVNSTGILQTITLT